jgi:hypothetical protein
VSVTAQRSFVTVAPPVPGHEASMPRSCNSSAMPLARCPPMAPRGRRTQTSHLSTTAPHSDQLMLIMTIGQLPDAMKPGIHCARTHWIQGFMTFQLARSMRIAMLMVPMCPESDFLAHASRPRPTVPTRTGPRPPQPAPRSRPPQPAPRSRLPRRAPLSASAPPPRTWSARDGWLADNA